MSATLEEMFNKDSILDVSFFNFENAITAAYFADAELNIVKANKNFKALFPNIKNIEGFNILALLGRLGVSDEQIEEFSNSLQRDKKVLIPQLKIKTSDAFKTFSFLATFTENGTFSYLNGVQGQLIDRTEEYRLHEQNQTLLAENETANQRLKEKSEKLESIANRLAKYLSPQVYETIFSDRMREDESYTRKNLTVFFSDIVSFTDISDTLEPEKLAHIINSYLSDMTEIAIANGGTIDKFIGDAVMVFFGDPDSAGEELDAFRCVKMALEMQQKIAQISRSWKSKKGISHGLNVRMGNATGYCTVGNFGSSQRLDYTVLGSPVNMAARLESLCPPGEVLLSNDTASLLNDRVKTAFFDDLKVKGFSKPVSTFKALALNDAADQAPTGLVHDSANIELYVKNPEDLESIIAELRHLEIEFSAQLKRTSD